MAIDKDRPKPLRVHNVRMHGGKRSETGTLTVDRHHLIFSYTPGSHGDSKTSRAPSLAAESSTTSAAGSNGTRTSTPLNSAKASLDRPRPKTKTAWIPYPMIARCTLRPSHLQHYAPQTQPHMQQSELEDSSGDLFPPNFGTSDYGRPSTDSTSLAPYSSPRRPASPAHTEGNVPSAPIGAGRSPALRIRCRDFQMMAFHFLSPHEGKSADDAARDVFFELRSRCCPQKIKDMLAFHFDPPKEELAASIPPYDARKEFARMDIGAQDGPGAAWRVSEINKDYAYSPTYPSLLCVPRIISDNTLKYGGAFRSKSRIPALAYLHFNGGSITRCSQPLVGITKKRSAQDEKLVSAIFSSHTPALTLPEDSPEQQPSLAPPQDESGASDASAVDAEIAVLSLNDDGVDIDESAAAEGAQAVRPKIYGSTRSNLIVDARPYKNMMANKMAGGGIEDPAIYKGTADIPVQVVFLDIDNIHVMRKSLQMVIDSFGNADYLYLPPDQSLLRKSKWLEHIATVIDGSELIARAVGLAGSHVLTHCSDGWDRTSQVSALAQIMLDPHYRTLDGFITLVQKEFLTFGHKFKDRDCIMGSEKWFEIENERIAPSQSSDENSPDPNSLNAFGSKALNSARHWFDKRSTNLFRKDNPSDETGSRPPSPPPNPVIHSSPSAKTKEKKKRGTDVDEMAPIFHQFLDAVYQMQRQYPHAFEFNERFLLRLLYQIYACQYGEFLFNNEKDRSQHQLPSVWPFFLARRKEFTNAEYAPKEEESLLFPKKGKDQKVEVRWWARLFGREDEEMNVRQVVLPSAEPVLAYARDDTAAMETTRVSSASDALRGHKSTPNLVKPVTPSRPAQDAEAAAAQPSRSSLTQQKTHMDVLTMPAESPKTTERQEDSIEKEEGIHNTQADQLHAQPQSFKLDFAAFAAQNAFQDR